MGKINDGGHAFPQPAIMGEREIISASDYGEGGMTLRDYFAAKAMQEIMAFKFMQPIEDGMTKYSCAEQYAESAYIMADAMLEARKK